MRYILDSCPIIGREYIIRAQFLTLFCYFYSCLFSYYPPPHLLKDINGGKNETVYSLRTGNARKGSINHSLHFEKSRRKERLLQMDSLLKAIFNKPF